MQKATLEITGKDYSPYFTEQVIFHSELVGLLKELHLAMMREEKKFQKEELFFFLLEQLMAEYTEQKTASTQLEPSTEINAVCNFLEKKLCRKYFSE